MRITRCLLAVVGLALLFLVGPHTSLTQGQRGGAGKRGMFDPNKMFDRYSGGADVFDVEKVPEETWDRIRRFDPQAKEKMLGYLESKGVKNGQFPRELFGEYMQGRTAGMKMGGRPKGEGGAAGGDKGAGGKDGTKGEKGDGERDLEAEARASFARMDRNGDKVLTRDEVGRSPLGRDFDTWDENKDGKIQIEEYIKYYKERETRRAEGAGGAPIEPAEPEWKRPTVYRVGHMPKELPKWFTEYDGDKDGQVGLYEWKAKDLPLEKFLAMDQNGDGFLTVEEVLRYERVQAKLEGKPIPGSPSVSVAGFGGMVPGGMGRGGMVPGGMGRGGMGRGGMGRGGMGKGGKGRGGMGGDEGDAQGQRRGGRGKRGR